MTKQEIIESLSNCIALSSLSDNSYIKNKLTQLTEALIKEWSDSSAYEQEIKQVLNYNETMDSLDNIKIR